LKCRKYVIATAHLRDDAPWTGTLRRLAEAGGSIVSKDEETRRVVVEAPAARAGEIVGVLSEAGRVVLEVKAACRGAPSPRELARKLASRGFYLSGPRGEGPIRRVVAYGVLGGRYVMVNAWGSRLALKVGGVAKSRRVTGVLPSGVFLHGPEGIKDALEGLERAVRELRGIL